MSRFSGVFHRKRGLNAPSKLLQEPVSVSKWLRKSMQPTSNIGKRLSNR